MPRSKHNQHNIRKALLMQRLLGICPSKCGLPADKTGWGPRYIDCWLQCFIMISLAQGKFSLRNIAFRNVLFL